MTSGAYRLVSAFNVMDEATYFPTNLRRPLSQELAADFEPSFAIDVRASIARGKSIGVRSIMVLLFTLSACNRQSGELPPSEVPVKNVLAVSASDYFFEAPEQIPAGVITIVMENHGPEARHHVALVKLEEGRSLEEFVEATLAVRRPVDWVVHVGGPESVPPGNIATATVTLEAGDYLLVCYVGTGREGLPHFARGMVRPLRVVESDRPISEPEPDAVITMFEYGYALSDSVRAGQRTFKVMNEGVQPHNVLMFALEPGETLASFMTWWDAGRTDVAPGQWIGGMTALNRGRHAYFTVDLKSGLYVLLCLVEDREDGRPHILHGMVQEIAVS